MVAPLRPSLDELSLVGGHPALDFVNTVDPRGGPEPPVDHLPDFETLCRWAARAGLVTSELAEALSRAGEHEPEGAAAVWRRAIALREALHRALVAIVAGRAPSTVDLGTVIEEGRDALARVSLSCGDPAGGRGAAVTGERGAPAFHLVLEDSSCPEAVLWTIARSALELLTEVDASRLRICPVQDGGCGWVVLDNTRNRSRRWCDMGACGTEAKSRRLTERRRAARKGGG